MAPWSVRSQKLRNIHKGRSSNGNLMSQAPPCFGRHGKPLVPAVFPVVNIHFHALEPCGGLRPRPPYVFL
jgi:hypothetical protein